MSCSVAQIIVPSCVGGDDEEKTQAKEAGFEDRGTGANEYVYWVCNSLLEHWSKLADIKPSQI